MTLYDNIWQYMTIYDNIWRYMTIYDNIWRYMTKLDLLSTETLSWYFFLIVHLKSLFIIRPSDKWWQFQTRYHRPWFSIQSGLQLKLDSPQLRVRDFKLSIKLCIFFAPCPDFRGTWYTSFKSHFCQISSFPPCWSCESLFSTAYLCGPSQVKSGFVHYALKATEEGQKNKNSRWGGNFELENEGGECVIVVFFIIFFVVFVVVVIVFVVVFFVVVVFVVVVFVVVVFLSLSSLLLWFMLVWYFDYSLHLCIACHTKSSHLLLPISESKNI